jgi:hypothetical protein
MILSSSMETALSASMQVFLQVSNSAAWSAWSAVCFIMSTAGISRPIRLSLAILSSSEFRSRRQSSIWRRTRSISSPSEMESSMTSANCFFFIADSALAKILLALDTTSMSFSASSSLFLATSSEFPAMLCCRSALSSSCSHCMMNLIDSWNSIVP